MQIRRSSSHTNFNILVLLLITSFIMTLPQMSTSLPMPLIPKKPPTITQKLVTLAAPTLITLSLDPLLSAADTNLSSFCDTTGSGNLSTLSLSTPVINFSCFLFNGVFGTSVLPSLVARERGEKGGGDVPSASARSGIKIALSAGLVASAVLVPAALFTPAPTLLTPSPPSQLPAFLALRLGALPLTFLLTTTLSTLRAYQDTVTPLRVLLFVSGVNFLLTYGATHLLNMDAVGVAAGTVIAEGLGAIGCLAVLRNRGIIGDGVDEGGFGAGAIARSSSASFIRSLLLQAYLLSSAVVVSTGTDLIGSHQVCFLLWIFASFLCDSIGSAAQSLIGEKVGEGESAEDVASVSLKLGGAAGVLLGGAIYCFDAFGGVNYLVEGASDEVVDGTRRVLPLVALCQPVNGVVFAADGVLQGAGLFTYEAKAMAASVLAGAATVATLAGLGHGDLLEDVWIGLVAVQAVRMVGTVHKIRTADEFN